VLTNASLATSDRVQSEGEHGDHACQMLVNYVHDVHDLGKRPLMRKQVNQQTNEYDAYDCGWFRHRAKLTPSSSLLYDSCLFVQGLMA